MTNQIYCVIPFYAKESMTPASLWKPSAPKIKDEVFYDYIKEGKEAMKVYGIDFVANPLWGKFFNRELVAVDKKKATQPDAEPQEGATPFRMLGDGGDNWMTPRLILSGRGYTGMLVLPVRISGTPSMEQVVDFVNRFHKYSSGQGQVFRYIRKEGDGPIVEEIDSLGLGYRKRKGGETTPGTWILAALIKALLAPLGEVIHFNSYRAHMFSYLLLDGAPAGESLDFRCGMLRLIHRQTSRYAVLPGDFDTIVMQTFRNIYFGVDVEGGAMVQWLKQDESDTFFRDYAKGSLQGNFLWIYFISLMQRYTLLDIDRRLGEATPTEGMPTRAAAAAFRKSVARTCEARLGGSFTTVSGMAHVNRLYSFITERLDVKALYKELDDKLETIDTWLELTASENRERFERFIQIGGVVLAVLAILYGMPQAVTATADVWDKSMWILSLIWTIPCLLGAIIIYLLRKK